MKLTQKQIETIKVLAEFKDPSLRITGLFSRVAKGYIEKEFGDLLTDLNKLAEIYRKIEPHRKENDLTLDSAWSCAGTGSNADTEEFAHTLAQIITELNLTNKTPEQREN